MCSADSDTKALIDHYCQMQSDSDVCYTFKLDSAPYRDDCCKHCTQDEIAQACADFYLEV